MGKIEFDKKRIREIENINDMKNSKFNLSTSGSCNQYRYAVAKKAITSGNFYFEVKLNNTGGCYSCVGFCNQNTLKDSNCSTRLGDDENGWAMRTYGNHSDSTFSGMRHAGQSTTCFMDWVSGDICGALIDVGKKTIQYYRNGKKLDGCVFKKIKGKKFFPVVQICHSGKDVDVNFNAKYPKGVTKDDEDGEEEGEKSEKTSEKKKSKPKYAFLTPKGYSERYANLYKNKLYSDATIKFPSGEEIPAHKSVLGMACDVLDKHFENSNTYEFQKEVDENAAKNVIQFLYSGSLEYSNEADLVLFMILANSLSVKNLGEFKVPAKVYLNGIVGYIEKDMSKLSEFDKLCESVDFKKMEKEDLTKLYAKKKWLQKSSTFLNQIILKDMEDSEEEEEKESGEDESEEKDSEESEESEDSE